MKKPSSLVCLQFTVMPPYSKWLMGIFYYKQAYRSQKRGYPLICNSYPQDMFNIKLHYDR